jgi:hypothetical protein
MHPTHWYRDDDNLCFVAVTRCAHVGEEWVVQGIAAYPAAPFVMLTSHGAVHQSSTSLAAAEMYENRAETLRTGSAGNAPRLAA